MLLTYIGTNDSLYPHVQMDMIQVMEMPLTDGYTMCVICMASVTRGNSSYHVKMKWSGVGLRYSLWVNQLEAERHKNCIVRKLCFSPWLDSQAGEYTCRVTVKDGHNFRLKKNKIITINGKCVGNDLVTKCLYCQYIANNLAV